VFAAIKVYDDEDRKSKKLWGYCSCPAGVDATCKHSYALMYKLWSLERLGTEVLEMDFDVPTPTGIF